MKETIRKAIAGSDADYTEVRVERAERSQVLFRKDRLENIESSTEVGGVVRALKDGGWGIAVFNDLSTLKDKVREASRVARLVASRTEDRAALAEAPAVHDEVRATLKQDFRQVPLEEKKRLVESYNRILLGAGPKIVSTLARYTDSFREITFANSEGTYLVQEIPDVTLLLAAIASDGGANIQQGFAVDRRGGRVRDRPGPREGGRGGGAPRPRPPRREARSGREVHGDPRPRARRGLHPRGLRPLLRGGLPVQEREARQDHDARDAVWHGEPERRGRRVHPGPARERPLRRRGSRPPEDLPHQEWPPRGPPPLARDGPEDGSAADGKRARRLLRAPADRAHDATPTSSRGRTPWRRCSPA